MTSKKKGSAVRKLAVGAGLAAAAGAAAMLSAKKTRKKLESKAKKAVSQLKSDKRVKEIGTDTADLLGRLGEAIKNFFK
jgi:hypothetical protein